MSFFDGVLSVTGVPFLMFFIFAIAVLGFLIGRITIKGVSLGDAGVFVVALLAGAFVFGYLDSSLTITIGGETVSYAKNALKITENLGLIMFVTSVGFIAGPNFFSNIKKNFKSYALLSLVIIILGGLTAVACIVFFGCSPSMAAGLLSGALTSTPAFSASKDTIASIYAENPELASQFEDVVTVGYGIAYLFGVIGVVLFVQIIPKLCKADMDEERKKITAVDTGKKTAQTKKLFNIDGFGIAAFALAVVLGLVVGGIKIPMGNSTFSLGTTGGCLLAALVISHFGRIGAVNLRPDAGMLKVFRELGLMFFLIGAGVPGGASFVQYFKVEYFFYGMAITIVPMIVGFILAKYVIKLPLFNNLGGITGGMTSTPALGTLINVTKTEDVASAYAAAYPVALIAVVLVSQFILLLFPETLAIA